MTIKLPTILEAWLDKHMPGIGGVGSVSINMVDRLPLSFLGHNGRTLGRSVYILATAPGFANFGPDFSSPEISRAIDLLCHELEHVSQFRGWSVFWPLGYAVLGWSVWENAARETGRDMAGKFALDFPPGLFV